MTGGVLGLLGGLITGLLLYTGLLRIPLRYLFAVTSGMILLMAAGMASQAAGFFMQAGYLPDQAPLWDSSALLAVNTIPGQILHALAGYDARPTALQLGIYVSTIVLILIGMKTIGSIKPRPINP